ncbi:uncharacterized protein Gasu_02240 [Galdieria sulphuraria]|uniref:Uncharacterized protein n=1 Tax=Galdieria sulphuraria TaxID=130081 RepID=M2Y9Z2_GALSU|nr:uncharacterized protein Gasu_02240 [Galdieria sulphuraria]EME32873.1 hypothetical protein Gasu_02240 [Galdieria sulphuraria]|eukprot:XP_005709393.1 hypothetical protein Gasu_02240 [Galdieria sulphuraria]
MDTRLSSCSRYRFFLSLEAAADCLFLSTLFNISVINLKVTNAFLQPLCTFDFSGTTVRCFIRRCSCMSYSTHAVIIGLVGVLPRSVDRISAITAIIFFGVIYKCLKLSVGYRFFLYVGDVPFDTEIEYCELELRRIGVESAL